MIECHTDKYTGNINSTTDLAQFFHTYLLISDEAGYDMRNYVDKGDVKSAKAKGGYSQ